MNADTPTGAALAAIAGLDPERLADDVLTALNGEDTTRQLAAVILNAGSYAPEALESLTRTAAVLAHALILERLADVLELELDYRTPTAAPARRLDRLLNRLRPAALHLR